METKSLRKMLKELLSSGIPELDEQMHCVEILAISGEILNGNGDGRAQLCILGSGCAECAARVRQHLETYTGNMAVH